jgi:hypothetical protein
MPGGGGAIAVGSALRSALESSARTYRWAAATDGSQTAASLELASNGAPVMAIGGFNNEGGDITLARFETDVARRLIHYYIPGGQAGGPGGGGSDSEIARWVESHYKTVTIGGETVYDLTQPLK